MLFNEKSTTQLLNLMSGASFGTEEAMQKIRSGADPNIRTHLGNTLLHKLIEFYKKIPYPNEKAIFELLDKHKPDVNIKNNAGKTPLRVMLDSNNFCPNIALHLVKSGADVNTQSGKGDTILHHLFKDYKNTDDELIKQFVKIHKAKIYIKNIDGISPMDLAKKRFYEDRLKKLFLESSNGLAKAIEDEDVEKVNEFISCNDEWLKAPLNSNDDNALQIMAKSNNAVFQTMAIKENKKEANALKETFAKSSQINKFSVFNDIQQTAKKNIYAKRVLAELYRNNRKPFSFMTETNALELYYEMAQSNERDFFAKMMRDRLWIDGFQIKQFKQEKSKDSLIVSSLKNAFRVPTDDEQERKIAEDYIAQVAANKNYSTRCRCIAKTMEAIIAKSDLKWAKAQVMDQEVFTHTCNWIGLESGREEVTAPTL